MSRYDRTPTDVTVTVLDLSDVEQNALDYLRAHAQTDRDLGKEDVKIPSRVRTGWKWGIVDTPHGIYALCTEGVGPSNPITEDNLLEVEIFVDAYEDGGGISIFPACSYKLGENDLLKYATEEQVPLAEFVR